jgi:hypothetical protein
MNDDHALPIDQSGWPEHLRDDAPSQQCDGCGRRTWDTAAFGDRCFMPQPGGPPCGGTFRERWPR